jgi:hypothetical protein
MVLVDERPETEEPCWCITPHVRCPECQERGKRLLTFDSCYRECPNGHHWKCNTGYVFTS